MLSTKTTWLRIALGLGLLLGVRVRVWVRVRVRADLGEGGHLLRGGWRAVVGAVDGEEHRVELGRVERALGTFVEGLEAQAHPLVDRAVAEHGDAHLVRLRAPVGVGVGVEVGVGVGVGVVRWGAPC